MASMCSDVVSINAWFHNHKLDMEGHMYTKAYHYIVKKVPEYTTE